MTQEKKLFEILDDNLLIRLIGQDDVKVKSLQIDSRKVNSGDAYFAIKGHISDGHDFIESAIENGAGVIFCEDVNFEYPSTVTVAQVQSVRDVVAHCAAKFYDHPSEDLELVGITGTNGKTTVATLLWQLFTSMGYKVGLISTVENKIGNKIIPSTHTTPDVISLNKLLAHMKEEGCVYVFMEVSSHAVDQKRIKDVDYVGGVFTNMSHDHLDYHKTFKEYIWAKKKFFDALPSDAFALVNVDDKRGEVMVQNTDAEKLTYALKRGADYRAKILSNSVEGLQLRIDGHEAHFRLVGEFNAYNILSVYGTAVKLGFDPIEVLQHLSNISGAEGRFENIKVEGVSKIGIVDYAHTPDALENVLNTITKVKSTKSKIVTVVGCGGDRDAAKRPKMARIAAHLSDTIILTSDNPRTEDPEMILNDMESGLASEMKKGMIRISDRKQAIKTAVMIAGPNDIILVAGKGHEKYQEINGEKFPFDDKKVLLTALSESA
ncbi:MAG: UDP-N-acetylmuramoyl-L-alanyl-D-glutamate--2,6-diaminopimelate ligase [Saprospiraceae bacterium]|nr:UDP-N-acetylmuramoyl-L-alanyl-D-glutamate--2,6-diaminopimelate ligase [Saprospiraceae bacterium]